MPPASGRWPGSAARFDVLVVVGEPREALDGPEGVGARGVIFLSDEPGAASRLAAAGLRAWGLLGLDTGAAALAAAVRAVHAGLIVSAPGSAAGPSPIVRPPGEAPRLTPREREVLDLLARGLSNKQIAWELGVSEGTVKYHVAALYAKLGASNRTEALRLGIERGVLSL